MTPYFWRGLLHYQERVHDPTIEMKQNYSFVSIRLSTRCTVFNGTYRIVVDALV